MATRCTLHETGGHKTRPLLPARVNPGNHWNKMIEPMGDSVNIWPDTTTQLREGLARQKPRGELQLPVSPLSVFHRGTCSTKLPNALSLVSVCLYCSLHACFRQIFSFALKFNLNSIKS